MRIATKTGRADVGSTITHLVAAWLKDKNLTGLSAEEYSLVKKMPGLD